MENISKRKNLVPTYTLELVFASNVFWYLIDLDICLSGKVMPQFVELGQHVKKNYLVVSKPFQAVSIPQSDLEINN